jgi:membrane-bound lytic murein transglycosylase F
MNTPFFTFRKKNGGSGTYRTSTVVSLILVTILIAGAFVWFRTRSGLHHDLPEIRKSGRLRVLLSYDPINYFIYRGAPMGYSYELARSFARSLDIPLDVVVVRDMNQQLAMLMNGDGDLLAHLMTITDSRKGVVDFSIPLDSACQVLIQRQSGANDSSARLVRSIEQLRGKRVYVRENSAYYSTLKAITKERGIEIDIVPVQGSLSTSELIGKVNDGTLEFTVADHNIASTHQAVFQGVDIKTALSGTLPLAWAVRKQSPELLDALNHWVAEIRKNGDLAVIRDKYYNSQYRFRKHTIQSFYSSHAGTISRYDNLVRQEAKSIDWDWRLLSALIYEESQFDPEAVSWAGAVGLMQLMPSTGAQFRARNLYDPADNLKVGTRFLKSLQIEWKEIQDPSIRLKFILASYNVGIGHVRDAQKLAAKFGARSDLWEDNVEKYLKLKSEPRYYNDISSNLGYCNGNGAVHYTRNIIDRYRLYSAVIPE